MIEPQISTTGQTTYKELYVVAQDKIADLEADYKELAEAKPDWDKISYKERLQRANEHYRKYRKQKKEEYKAKIAELEAPIKELLEIKKGWDEGSYSPDGFIGDVLEVLDNLEKSDDY